VIGYYAAVAVGGAIGAAARWGIEQTVVWPGPPTWPIATLGINLVGCLLLGLFLGAGSRSAALARWRPFLAVGVLGGFTTYSAFAVETIQLAEDGALVAAAGYAAASLVGGLIAVRVGEVLGLRAVS
jgi:fluoride exporter